jgi:hypothetical protein
VSDARRLDGWRSAWFPLLVCSPLLVLRTIWLFTPQPLQDFVTYWAAGRLLLSGRDPYSMAAMQTIERSLGWQQAHTLVMLNPPWILPFVAVLALLPFKVAHLLWFAVSLAVEGTCSLALWRYFGGEKRLRWIALVVLATFLPASGAEAMGQMTPLILAGITGFVFALRRERYVLAGACLALLGLKPNLMYLVLLAVLFWSIEKRKWMVPITAFVCAGGISAVAIVCNHNVIGYFHNTVDAAVATPCGVGGALRAIFGTQHVWLQFLPCVAGLVWFAFYWVRHHRDWSWEEQLPLLLLVSLGSSAYFWAHDFVVGLPALIALAVLVSRARTWVIATGAYFMVQVAIVDTRQLSLVWMAATSLLWIVLYCIVPRLHCAEGLDVELSVAMG